MCLCLFLHLLSCFLPFAGVEVSLQLQPASRPAARIAAAEQLSMQQLLEEYAANTGMDQEVLALARGALQVGFGGLLRHCQAHCR